MKIIIAKHAGFCSGVDFAYKKAIEVAKSNEPVYILGLLVHNASVIQKLENLGIKSVSDLSEIPKASAGTIIIFLPPACTSQHTREVTEIHTILLLTEDISLICSEELKFP